MKPSTFRSVLLLWFIFAVLLVLSAWHARPADLSYSNMFYCLGEIESGNNDYAVGLHGERGRYQMTQHVWREFNSPATWNNFRYMTNSDFAFCSAMGVMLNRESDFRSVYHRLPTPFEWAMLWRAPSRVNHPTAADRDYSSRFTNLLYKCVIENKNRKPPNISKPVK